MNADTPRTEEHFELHAKAVDGLLSPTDEARLQTLCEEDPTFAEEIVADRSVKADTDAMLARIRDARRAADAPPGHDHVRRLSVAGVLLGLATLFCWGTWTILSAPLPFPLQAGLVVIIGGVLTALASLIYQRLTKSHQDPYEKIER